MDGKAVYCREKEKVERRNGKDRKAVLEGKRRRRNGGLKGKRSRRDGSNRRRAEE